MVKGKPVRYLIENILLSLKKIWVWLLNIFLGRLNILLIKLVVFPLDITEILVTLYFLTYPFP